jgi:hypothetical protein
MAKIADHVIPGQLINANLMNLVLDKLSSLDDAVKALQGGAAASGAVVITGISPSGPVQVGQPLTVSGQNFGFSVGAQQVFIDSLQINAFQAGSSDQQLVFLVPASITNVPAQGRSATLSISNGILPPATRTIFLLPGVTLGGSLTVNYVGPVTGVITPNVVATLQFTLISGANLDATYSVQPVVTGPPNAAAFNSNLQVLDATQTVIPSNTIQLFAGQQKSFFVNISPVPAGSTGSFDLTVNASAGGISGSSGPQGMSVGVTPPQPDNSITSTFSSGQVLPADGGSVTGSQISLKAGAQAKVTLLFIFTVAATYDITAVPTSGTGWSATLFAQTTITPMVIGAADLNNPAKAASRTLDFIVAPGAGASAAGKIEFRAKNETLTALRAYPMALVLAS